MEIKTIEVLQQEAAEELNYANWSVLRQCHNYNLTAYDNIWKTLLHRYESQFQTNTDLITTEICVLRERGSELEGMLGRCKNEFQQYRDAFGQSSSLESEIESLINKSK